MSPHSSNSRKKIDLNPTNNVEDTKSSNRSTTTTGASLANKIGQAMSRILSSGSGAPFDPDNEPDDDISDLIQLIDECNGN